MRDQVIQSPGSRRWAQRGIRRVRVADLGAGRNEGSGESVSRIQALDTTRDQDLASQSHGSRHWAQLRCLGVLSPHAPLGLVGVDLSFHALPHPWFLQPKGLS